MTIAVRVISIFILSLTAVFILSGLAYADFLIRPVIDQSSSTSYPSLLTENLQPYSPSISFGELLAKQASITASTVLNQEVSPDQQYKMSRTALIAGILNQLEESYTQEFSYQNSVINENTLREILTPTPFILIPTEIPTPTLIPTSFPTMTPFPIASFPQPTTNNSPQKTSYTIALLGDSMTDTLGNELYHLKTLLSQRYPSYTFTLINYGQGATDLDSGLKRLTETTTYLGEQKAPLLSYKPDIIVVESFAYNHWGGEKYDLDRQWLTIAKIIDTVKEKSPDTKIILAATIAPHALVFGDGVLNWPKEMKWLSSQITKAYLQNLINFATSQKFPLADAYHASLGKDGNGQLKYISASDHLHPSGDGGWLFAAKIVEAIQSNKLIL